MVDLTVANAPRDYTDALELTTDARERMVHVFTDDRFSSLCHVCPRCLGVCYCAATKGEGREGLGSTLLRPPEVRLEAATTDPEKRARVGFVRIELRRKGRCLTTQTHPAATLSEASMWLRLPCGPRLSVGAIPAQRTREQPLPRGPNTSDDTSAWA